jgi:electron transfer flavoprotein beta subunit
VQSIVNPFDMYAIEEALRIKERLGAASTKVTVLSMGPSQAEEALREAVSMGADEMVLMSDRAFAGSDTWATSYTLAKGIQKLGKFDLIICGKQAIDGAPRRLGPDRGYIGYTAGHICKEDRGHKRRLGQVREDDRRGL